ISKRDWSSDVCSSDLIAHTPDFSRTHGIGGYFRRWAPLYGHFSLCGWFHWFRYLIYTYCYLFPRYGFRYRDLFAIPAPDLRFPRSEERRVGKGYIASV